MPMPDLVAFQLSHMAGCMDPDSKNSVGANFLRQVYLSISEFIDELPIEEEDDGKWLDRVSEAVDSDIPIMTHELWQTFVDLGGYNEDLSELDYEFNPDETHKMPATALYIIGTNLANALISKYRPAVCPNCEGTGQIAGIGNREMPCESCGATGKVPAHLAAPQEE